LAIPLSLSNLQRTSGFPRAYRKIREYADYGDPGLRRVRGVIQNDN
jgi:hypothetical protein